MSGKSRESGMNFKDYPDMSKSLCVYDKVVQHDGLRVGGERRPLGKYFYSFTQRFIRKDKNLCLNLLSPDKMLFDNNFFSFFLSVFKYKVIRKLWSEREKKYSTI